MGLRTKLQLHSVDGHMFEPVRMKNKIGYTSIKPGTNLEIDRQSPLGHRRLKRLRDKLAGVK